MQTRCSCAIVLRQHAFEAPSAPFDTPHSCVTFVFKPTVQRARGSVIGEYSSPHFLRILFMRRGHDGLLE